MQYNDFLKTKICIGDLQGFSVNKNQLNPILLPHQKDISIWALAGGRRAIFASFGLGKTFMELEVLRLIGQKEGGRQLVIAPLGVRQEFKVDVEKLAAGNDPNITDEKRQELEIWKKDNQVLTEIKFIRRNDELTDDGLYITNYESIRDGRLDINMFNGVSLDEASVLRSYGSKTFQNFLTLFQNIKYRFVATATPSPNRYKELIHYAGFLGIMDTGQALTRFFQRDSKKANNLTIYPHKVEEFWLWISSWAIFIQKPSDLGYSDEGYELPELRIHYHEVKSDSENFADKNGQVMMFSDVAMSLQAASKEKRESIKKRVAKAAEIVAHDPDRHFILWHDREAERHELKRQIADVTDVYGSQDLEIREDRIINFSIGKFKRLATKPILSGSGCNFQRHCHTAIFVGVGFKFNDFIQAIHRIHRFLQLKRCDIHLIYTDREKSVLRVLEGKWVRHNEMVEKMTEIIKKYGLSHKEMAGELKRSIGIERLEVKGEKFTLVNNDSVEDSKTLEENSVDLICTSIPFANHYEYTPCHDEKTEVLTKRGWIYFKDLTMNDYISTVNKKSLVAEWQKPSEVIYKHYNGEMIHFRERNSIDLMVTPDHKMLVDNRVGNHKSGRKTKQFKLISAQNLSDNYVFRKWQMVTTSIPGTGDYPKNVAMPKCDHRKGVKIIQKLKTEDVMELAGWYISEGHCRYSENKQRRGEITISQSQSANPIYRNEIIDLFDRLGLNPNCNNKKNITGWNINIAEFLRNEFGSGSYNKKIPQWVKALHPDLLKILRNTMMKGDGNSNGLAYTSFSHKLCDDFQEICFFTGWRASVSKNIVRIGQKNKYPEIRNRPIKTNYNGMIGCATVPNHTLVTRRNGKIIVSGNSYNDFGHTSTNDQFWEQMDFLTPQLLRILKPGRIYACHTKDRILFGNATGKGAPTVSPFHAEAIFHAQKHGFDYMGMITVVTDVVRENNQTYRLGWTENCKDGTKMGVGSPEYILLLRKPQTDRSRAYADEPVVKNKKDYTRARWQVDAHAFWRSSGDRLLTYKEMEGYGPDVLCRLFTQRSLENIYDYESHIKIGESLELNGRLPASFMAIAPGSHNAAVWHDINRMFTLNSAQKRRNLQMHVCPLQFDIIDRLIVRYSNEGEMVYDPFCGIGSVPLRALKLKRRAAGCELNADYFLDSVRYCQAEERSAKQITLFDFENLNN